MSQPVNRSLSDSVSHSDRQTGMWPTILVHRRRPPLCVCSNAIASLKAGVQSEVPSPLAPRSTMFTMGPRRPGNTTGNGMGGGDRASAAAIHAITTRIRAAIATLGDPAPRQLAMTINKKRETQQRVKLTKIVERVVVGEMRSNTTQPDQHDDF